MSFKDDLDYSKRMQIKLKDFYKNRAFEGRYVFGEKAEYQKLLGIDTLMQIDDYNCIWIEEKFVRKQNDCIFIETESCTRKGYENKGWIKKSKADFLLYVFCLKKFEIYAISMKKLQNWFLSVDYESRYKSFINKTYNATRGFWVLITDIKKHVGYEFFKI